MEDKRAGSAHIVSGYGNFESFPVRCKVRKGHWDEGFGILWSGGDSGPLVLQR